MLIIIYLQGKIVECVHCGCRGCSGWRDNFILSWPTNMWQYFHRILLLK